MMRHAPACVTAAICAAAAIAAQPAPPAPPTTPSIPPTPWTETSAQRDARMAWWRDARFGIFIHWGPYSRLAGAWDGQQVEGVGEWILENGKIPASGYTREAKKFDPQAYDPEAWAKVIADSGAKYVVITSRHHDGYCLWDSSSRIPGLMDAQTGAKKRDLLAPLKAAAEKHGLKFGLYYSIMDWTHPDWSARRAWNDLWPGREPNRAAFDAYIEAQLRELATAYTPAVVWFDGEWEDAWTTDEGARAQRLVRELLPSAIVNDRCVKGRPGMRTNQARAAAPTQDVGDYGTPEQEVPRRALPDADWETCMTMNDTWGYKASDVNFKSRRELIRTLVDVASKGGNFLLNIGPDGDGRIPETSVRRLAELGEWLGVNGESIYATQAGPLRGLSFGRSTQRDGVIYVHIFDWPADGKIVLRGLRNEVTKVAIVGSPGAPVSFATSPDGPAITLPSQCPDPDATVLAIEIKGTPIVDAPPSEVLPASTVVLSAEAANLSGPRLALERRDADRDNIGFWTDAKAVASWTIDIPAQGLYDVSLLLSCVDAAAGNDFAVDLGDQQLRGTTRTTGSWEDFERMAIGRVRLDAGKMRVTVRAAGPVRFALMNLQDVRLVPVKGTK